jgi:hypothetical protein
MTNETENQESKAESTMKPPQSDWARFSKEQLKRKRAARQQSVEFAVESYEHPVYGYGVRPCWK